MRVNGMRSECSFCDVPSDDCRAIKYLDDFFSYLRPFDILERVVRLHVVYISDQETRFRPKC